MRLSQGYLTKAYYASQRELHQRIPELVPLAKKTIAVVGLGSLGAPSVFEFAKAGIGEIRLIDHDTVDPATTVRWPMGFRASGHSKATVLKTILCHDYPYTTCKADELKIGRIRQPEDDPQSDHEKLDSILDDVDLVYDATAELGVQHFLSDWAREQNIPYIGVAGTRGGWGGKVFRIKPKRMMGCWLCYRLHCSCGNIPEPPAAPIEDGTVQPTGCSDPTFTGSGFDMAQIALSGVRVAVSTLCEAVPDSYPSFDWDALHIGFRDDNGQQVLPNYHGYRIEIHPECGNGHDTYSK